MPLDDFQLGIVSALRNSRDERSPIAGGAAIQCHGFRLTDDLDIFVAAEALDEIARQDKKILESAGYLVVPKEPYAGFRECRVSKPMQGTTIIQWARGLMCEFFKPVPDQLFGFRLHHADLAANKALAAGSRTKFRDFIDLWMIDKHVIPLWRVACAAPGKDTKFNPFSLVEKIARNFHMARTDQVQQFTVTNEFSTEAMFHGLMDSIDEARTVLPKVRPEHYGRLELKAHDQPELSRQITNGKRWAAPDLGGSLPSFEGVDSEMIDRLISEYGHGGSRYTGKSPDSNGFGVGRRPESNALEDPPEIPAPFDSPQPPW